MSLNIVDKRPIIMKLTDADYGSLSVEQCAQLIGAQVLTPDDLGLYQFLIAPRSDLTPEMIAALQSVEGLTSVSVKLDWSEVNDMVPLTPAKFPNGCPASAIRMILFDQP